MLVHHRDAFTEKLGREPGFLKHFPGRELDFSKRGAAVEAGPFVEESAAVLESLGECGAVVRVDVDDTIAVFGRALAERSGNRDAEKRQRGASGHATE